MGIPSKPCKYCGNDKHFPFQCFQNPKGRKKYALRPGKQAKAWQTTRRNWFWENQAEFYTCYLCGKRMVPAETTLDHVVPRSRRPDLRHDTANLKPCCYACNSRKGSRTVDKL